MLTRTKEKRLYGRDNNQHSAMNKPSFLNRVRYPGIRMNLVVLVIGCILPIASISAYLIFSFYKYEQAQLISNSISRARAIISAVDRDFANTQASLLALGTSHRLATGDLSGFHARAILALKNIRAENILVVDMNGQMLLTTRQPFGTPLPKLHDLPLLQRILKTGTPDVSDLYVSTIAKRLIYTIAVPIKHDGVMVSLLGATVAPAQLLSVLAEQKLPDNWRAVIVDRTGTVVARTHNIEKFLGVKIAPQLLQQISISNEGSRESRNLDGVPVITVYSRSPATNWSVVIGMPLKGLTTGLRQTLIDLIIATAVALGIGLMLAWFIGGRIARSVTALGKTALALSFGETLTLPPLSFTEANELGQALLNAESTLHQSKYNAHHDALTGLANRTLFYISVDQQAALCERDQTGLAILYIDLDGFKAVNDTYGHAVGDVLLKAVSNRLKDAIRESDIAARLGGDEFAIALIHSDMENAKIFAGKLIQIISKPYQLGELEANISASIGVAGFPGSAINTDMLLKKADKAMYAAKASGKQRYCVTSD
jgi:diguanylate cyclase (GGDEF)-like protein